MRDIAKLFPEEKRLGTKASDLVSGIVLTACLDIDEAFDRRPLKFPNLTIQVSLTRSSFGHVLEGSPGPPGSIWRRPRHPVIDTANLGLGVRPLGGSLAREN